MQALPRSFGRYTLRRAIGQGVSGSVYEAEDGRTGQAVALKLLHHDRTESPVAVARFHHEAAIAQAVTHPHVVRVLDAGEIEGQLFLTMTLVDGWPLHRFFGGLTRRSLQPPIEDLLATFAGAVRGVGALHDAKDPDSGDALTIVHRDLAPKNLLLTPEATLMIIDFGIGRSPLSRHETQTGVMVGTPGYVSPEAVLGRPVDHRADLYALGVILYEMLTLQRFVPRGPIEQMLRTTVEGQPTLASAHRPAISEALDNLLLRATHKDPQARFPSAAAMLHALSSAAPGRPDRDRMVGYVTRALEGVATSAEITSEDDTQVTEDPAGDGLTVLRGGVTEATEVDFGFSPRTPKRGRLGPVTATALLFGCLLILGVLLGRQPSDPVTQAQVPAEAPPVLPRAAPAETPRPPVEAPPVAPPSDVVEAAPDAGVEVARPRRRPKTQRKRTVDAERTTPRTPLRDRVRSLSRRASALRRKHPNRRAALDQVLRDLAMEGAAKESIESHRRLDAIVARLDKLSAQH